MPIKVRIPTPLRKLTHDEEVVHVDASTVGGAIAELQTRYPGIQERLVDEKGEVRRFVNVYVNEEDIRFLQNQSTPLKDGDEITFGMGDNGGRIAAPDPRICNLHLAIARVTNASGAAEVFDEFLDVCLCRSRLRYGRYRFVSRKNFFERLTINVKILMEPTAE